MSNDASQGSLQEAASLKEEKVHVGALEKGPV